MTPEDQELVLELIDASDPVFDHIIDVVDLNDHQALTEFAKENGCEYFQSPILSTNFPDKETKFPAFRFESVEDKVMFILRWS